MAMLLNIAQERKYAYGALSLNMTIVLDQKYVPTVGVNIMPEIKIAKYFKMNKKYC